MLDVLRNRTFAALFSAQVVALVGTGLLTVALGLLAYDLAGADAGAVLGTAYAIKMIAYVGLSPVASALVARLPRRGVLVAADAVRCAVAAALPFIDSVGELYLAIFVLQAASATFTPTFQAAIPDVLPDEARYTRALSLSRLAYDLENLLSPALAAALLTVIGYHWLFAGTGLGFLASAVLVWGSGVPSAKAGASRPFLDRLTRGARLYLATPRLRGLLALTLGAAASSAFVIVNTVVLVRTGYGKGEADVAVAMAAFGAGSMAAALALPRVLERLRDRSVMLAGAAGIVALSLAGGLWLWADGLPPWPAFLGLWLLSGLCYAAVVTPSGRLLRRSSGEEDRPALFAAQFALSHVCWLVTYPLAGLAGASLGLGPTLALLGLVALAGLLAALGLWRPEDDGALDHRHPDLPPDDPHLRRHGAGPSHSHPITIDDLHPHWPRAGR